MLGKWIDSLNDSERDRIIEHPDPTFDGMAWWDIERGCGCLVGCVVGRPAIEGSRIGLYPTYNEQQAAFIDYSQRVGFRFPDLTDRFTPERIWRVVKARAAKANRVPVPERETVAV